MGGFLHAVNRLELSDQQREDIFSIMEEAAARLEELADPEEDAPGIMEYFCSDGFSRSGLEDMLNIRIERMRRANGIAAEALAGVRAVLTPGQLEELSGMERERCMEHRMEGMGHPGEEMAPPHREMF
jgi:Spy/CpxP family protein refolding chaperone